MILYQSGHSELVMLSGNFAQQLGTIRIIIIIRTVVNSADEKVLCLSLNIITSTSSFWYQDGCRSSLFATAKEQTMERDNKGLKFYLEGQDPCFFSFVQFLLQLQFDRPAGWDVSPSFVRVLYSMSTMTFEPSSFKVHSFHGFPSLVRFRFRSLRMEPLRQHCTPKIFHGLTLKVIRTRSWYIKSNWTTGRVPVRNQHQSRYSLQTRKIARERLRSISIRLGKLNRDVENNLWVKWYSLFQILAVDMQWVQYAVVSIDLSM